MIEASFVIGGIGVVIVTAVTLLVVRALRQAQRKAGLRRRREVETRSDEVLRRGEQEACVELPHQPGVESEAHSVAEQEAQRQADEATRRMEEESRLTTEAESQRRTEERLRREADEAACRRAEEEARVATKAEARRKDEENARAAAQQEAARLAEAKARVEALLAKLAAKAEARRRAEEESRHAAEEESRRRAEKETRLADEAEVRRKAEEEARVDAEEKTLRDADERFPRKYRPVGRVAAMPETLQAPGSTSERETRYRALPIDVRLVFEHAGFCRVSLLPRRILGMPVELAVSGSGDPPEFLTLQEDWYQDVLLPNTEHLLREGVEWAGVLSTGQQVRWSLSGREIYVLARHEELSGFVNAPRLILGEEQVVLCTAERLVDVRSAIALTGSPEPVLLGSDSGVPEGWIGIRGVVPHASIAPSPDGDILDALRPLAEVEIALEGGIRIERQTWLSGFPPRVRLRGDVGTIGAVVIDGCAATLNHEGGYLVPGWDSIGDHNVWCTSGSRTYAIREGVENWEPWDAYKWSLGEPAADEIAPRPAVCGVLARPPRLARTDGRAIVVPASNPVLIGATPGEIEFCAPRRDVRAGQCVGFPWFEPVWAIPTDTLHCDKRFARILWIGTPRLVTANEQRPNVCTAERKRRDHVPGVQAWCSAIRMAGRKGLQIEPQQSDLTDLWKAYKKRAKTLWRRKR